MAFDPEELVPTEASTTQQSFELLSKGFNPEALVPGAEQIATEVFKANFDPENFASTSLRISLSRGDNLKEKKLRLKKFHPEGDIKILGKSLVLELEEDAVFFRESPQSQWKLVEPTGFDFTDIAEAIAPSAESIVFETMAAFFSGGGTIPATVGRQVAGAFVGETIEQGVQFARGVQTQSAGEILLESTIEGGFSALGGFAVSPLVALGNIAKGRGALQIGEEGIDVLAAANRIDPSLANKLTPGLVTDNPALQLSERQSAALLPGLQRRYRDLVKTLDTAIKSNVSLPALGRLTTRISRSFKNLSETFINRIVKVSTPASKGGKALQQGIEEYDLAARKIVDDLYTSARLIEEPQFNLVRVRGIAKNLRAGSKGSIDKLTEVLLKQIDNIKAPIQLPDGGVVSIGDQLRNVRTGAFAAKNVKPGEVASQATGQATDLLRVINFTLDNPLNPNSAFKTAWKKASAAARTRFTTLERATVVKAVKSQNPAELLRQFAQPGKVDDLLTLRNTISPKRWKEFTDSFVADIFDDPAKASANIKLFDKETLDVLIPRAEQPFLKRIATELSRVADVGVEEILERQIRNKNFMGELIETATPRRVSTIMRAANETNDKALRDSIRAGIFDWTWDNIIKQGKKLEINQPLLRDRILQLKKSGMWDFLPATDRQLLADAEIVSRAFRRVIDAGTSIQAAEAVKGIGRLQVPAIRSFIQAGIISHLYLSSAGRKILIGSGIPNSRGAALRLIGGALAQVSRTEDITELREEQ